MRGAFFVAVALMGSTVVAQTSVEVAATAGLTGVATPASSVTPEVALRLSATRPLGDWQLFGSVVTSMAQISSFRDLGSVIGVAWKVRTFGTMRLELYPFDGVRVREGFDFANIWGQPLANRTSAVRPLARLSLQHEVVDAWVAASGYNVLDPATLEPAVAWSVLGGTAVRLPKGFGIEARGGVHERNKVPGLATLGIIETVLAFGATARASWSYGGGVAPQVDLFTYAADPERFERYFAPQPYTTHVAAWVGIEGGLLSQNLQVQNTLQMRRDTTGYADLQARVRVGNLRWFGIVRVQPVQMIQFDAPGLPPFTALDTTIVSKPRIGGWLGTDYRFESASLEAGVQGRLIAPAEARLCEPTLPITCNGGTLVVHGANQFSILPVGAPTKPAVGVTFTTRYTPVQPLAIVASFDFEHDPSSSTFSTVTGEPIPTTRDLTRWKLYVQGRF